MQRVVTAAGDSLVGTQSGGMNGHVIEGKRVRGRTRASGVAKGYRAAKGRAVRVEEKGAMAQKKRCKSGESPL